MFRKSISIEVEELVRDALSLKLENRPASAIAMLARLNSKLDSINDR